MYEVSEKGQVRSLRFNKVKIRKLQVTQGYLTVGLTNVAGMEIHSVHRLVAETFITNAEGKSQVNHKDKNTFNNHVSNLEWVTPTENCTHGKGKAVKRLSSPPVYYKSVSEAARQLNGSTANISRAARENRFSLGSRWEYC